VPVQGFLAMIEDVAPRPAERSPSCAELVFRWFNRSKRGASVIDNGWGGDHVEKLMRLKRAVRILAEARRKITDRLQQATYPLVTLFPTDFPQHLRNQATRVLEFREKYVFHLGDKSYFRSVKPSDKTRFVGDIITLYEACLIDIGRGWPMWDFMYPKDE
jgi:hypothetical protein